jgi:diguanylate cyclase (GGDEF)-like protein
VARLGGDEFAVIVAPLAAADRLEAVLARIAQELGTPIAIDGRSVTASATIGIALFPDDGAEPDRLVRRADVALYRGKAKGRGAVVWHVEPEGLRPAAEGGGR